MPKFSFLVVGSLALLAGAVAADENDPPKSVEMKKSKALIDNKDFKPVVLLLKAALAKAPNNAGAWNLMGYAHRKLGQVDQALGFYQKALSLNAEHRGALECLGELYLQTGAQNRPRKC